MKIVFSNSKEASKYAKAFQMTEEPFDAEDVNNGIYLGKTLIYKIPFLLNFDKLVNPHISILGMTGSGKTYLLKSLITRQVLLNQYNVLLIDWNAEYTELISFLSGRTYKINSVLDLPAFETLTHDVTSIDLSGLINETDRLTIAKWILEKLLDFMHSLTPDKKTNCIIVIDEAWKLLNSDNKLGKLFREGRKYGFCIITATQLVKDVNNEVLANAACNFVFRLQGQENFDVLVSSGVIDQTVVNILQNLKRGSCFVGLSLKHTSAQRRFIINKIDGFAFDEYSIIDGEMITKISINKLNGLVSGLGLNNETKIQVLRFFEENERRVDLNSLIKLLINIGLKRQQIISFSRSVGIGDVAISMAYESIKGVSIVAR
jgi:hypothetical protein